MREHLGLYGSYLQFSSPHQRSLHHPVSLSFLTVSVLASSSITHPIPRVSLNRSHFAVAASSSPIRTLPRPTSPSTWSAASSVLPDTYLSSSPSPQTFDETPTVTRAAASSTAIDLPFNPRRHNGATIHKTITSSSSHSLTSIKEVRKSTMILKLVW